MNSARVFFRGGLLAYKALFNFKQTAVYIPTMLISPAFQILFFAYLGRYSGLADDNFFVVGNAIQATAIGCIYGMVLLLGNERQFDTFSAVIATSTRRGALYFGRAVLPIANGIVVTTFVLCTSVLLLDFRMPATALPAFGIVVLVSAVSCAMFGLTLGALALRLKDIWIISNLSYTLMLLLCGANVRPAVLPGWLHAISSCLPLTHGIEAARKVADGAALSQVAGLIGIEALIGGVYALLGYALLRLFEAGDRRGATLITV
ncbi:ABC transporter permease [Kribbella catacumbae]|uniref:ABC transporter permease n=1 Tax=Kribbella catacumbae TaxID=460086 RepID=UPI00038222DE|nr:ABC transporter permease [Kribbella catacumbae]